MSGELAEPRCFTRQCRHFRGVTQVDPGDGREKNGGNVQELDDVVWCFAFPSGIPDRIAYGDDEHTQLAPNQFGTIIYEKGPFPQEGQ